MGRYVFALAMMLVIGTSPVYAQDVMFVVTTPSANVHKAPQIGSPVIGKAPRGKSFAVVRNLGSWVSVSWPEGDNGVAYLHVSWGTLSGGTGAQARPVTATPVAARANASPTTAQVVQAPTARPASSLPSHVIGLGARVGSTPIGFAATGRAWTLGSLGLQIEAGQATHTSTLVSGQVRSMQFVPSLIYSPSNLVSNAIWARPYVGGGVNIYRSTLRSTFGTSVATDNGLGSQIFGGAEFTWSNIPQLVVSADLRRHWVPTTFDGFELGGFGFSMSAHWYVK